MKTILLPLPAFRRPLLLLVTVLAVSFAGSIHAADAATKKISINFDSTADFIESCGEKGTATASTLTAAQKASIIAKVKAKFEAALGAGKVDVCEGTGTNVNIIVNGGPAPGARLGKEYGDAGRPGEPCLVHQGAFAPCVDDALVNAISETIAHEAGHKLGLVHNWDEPATVMTEGGKVPKATRNLGTRGFNDADKVTLTNVTTVAKAEHKDSTGPTDLGIHVGDLLGPILNVPDDHHLNAYAFLQGGPPGTQFGYISHGGEFVYQGNQSATPQNPRFMSFLYTAGVDLAVRANGIVYSLSDGFGQYNLFAPNPNNPAVFMGASIGFMLPGGSASLQLQVVMLDQHSGGFLVPIVLAAQREGNLLKISWSAQAAGYQLEQANNLPSQTWGSVPVQPTLEQGRFVVRIPLPPQDPRRYFRLHRLEN